MIGAAHDLPGIAVVVDVAAPGQRLEADAQAARCRKFAKCAKIRGRTIDTAQCGRRNVAADQQQIGAQFLHQVELAFDPCEVAGALRLGHALEIPKRLEGANTQSEFAAKLSDVARDFR